MAAFARAPALGFDLVALSTYTARAFDAYVVADAYRALGVPVVFGGLHATVLPEEVAGHADAVVAGEGELLWPEVVDDFRRGGRAGLKRIYREARPGEFSLREGADAALRPPAARRGPGQAGAGPRSQRRAAPPRAVQPRDDPDLARLPVGLRLLRRVEALRAALPRQAGRARAGARWTRCGRCGGGRSSSSPTTTPSSTSRGRRELLRELTGRDIRYFTETDVSSADDEELLDLLYPSGCRQVLIGFESPRRPKPARPGHARLEGSPAAQVPGRDREGPGPRRERLRLLHRRPRRRHAVRLRRAAGLHRTLRGCSKCKSPC